MQQLPIQAPVNASAQVLGDHGEDKVSCQLEALGQVTGCDGPCHLQRKKETMTAVCSDRN